MKRTYKKNKFMLAVLVSMLLVVWAVPVQALNDNADQSKIYLARGGGGGNGGSGGGSGGTGGQDSSGMTGGFGQGNMQMERTRNMEQVRDGDQDQDRDQVKDQDRDE